MLLTLLPYLIVLISIAVITYAWNCLPAGWLRWYFVGAFLFMAAYKIYDPASDARGLLWGRHLFAYIGEILFFAFLTVLSKRYVEIDDAPQKPRSTVLQQNIVVLMPLLFFSSGISWYQLATDQGLPHILTLPVFVMVMSLTRLRLAVYESIYIRVATLFTVAIGAWIMIHVSEFMVESQKFIPGLEDYMPYIEFFWFAVGAGLFCYALMTFKRIHHDATTV
jgi:hypothetical protein